MPSNPKSLTTAIVYSLAVLAACLVHATSATRLAPALGYLFRQDKLAHLVAFAFFAALWIRALPTPRAYPIVAVVGLALGVGIEFLQRWLKAGGDFEARDVLADAAGLVAGLFAHRLTTGGPPRPTTDDSPTS